MCAVRIFVTNVVKPTFPVSAPMNTLIKDVSNQAFAKMEINKPIVSHGAGPKKYGTRTMKKKIVNKNSGTYPSNTNGIVSRDLFVFWFTLKAL